MNRKRMNRLVGLMALLGMLAALALTALWGSVLRAQEESEAEEGDQASSPARAAPMPERVSFSADADGQTIYLAACATCHGVRGAGNGAEAAGFEFPATNFRRGVYKLRSTQYEKLPTDADLARTIRAGMPGTEMVPYGRILTDKSIGRVAEYIKSFSPRFADPEQALDPKEDKIALPAARPFPPSAESVAAGAKVYQREECGTCHGDDGDGQGEDAAGMTDDWDRPISMLDWSRGVFKSGTGDLDLYRSIAAGMNGTPMEGYLEATTDAERWQMVDFIRSLEAPQGLFHSLFGDEPSGTNYR